MRKRIAIIGSGISGMTCGYLLHKHHDITVFESDDYIGGHTHTVDISHGGEKASIDTGFIVFNDRNYPNFIRLLDQIGVHYQPTEMSFSVRNDAINLEYNGHNLATLFAQRSNILKLSFYGMLLDIVRFNKAVRSEGNRTKTIGQYLEREKYSPVFTNNYLLPMISAIWSMGLESCLDFPLQFFARFFENHGLLDLTNRPQWYTIIGGSRNYIKPLTNGFSDRILLQTPVQEVVRTSHDGVIVKTVRGSFSFDEVIFACHADQALALLTQPTKDEKDILGDFRFSDNSVILHTDTSLLPTRKEAWASWNYRMLDEARQHTVLTYNMNILQCLDLKNTYLVSLNQPVKEEFKLQEFSYSHPVYSLHSIAAQDRWSDISGKDRIHYCGAYWFNGFHEDGVNSGLRVAKSLGETV